MQEILEDNCSDDDDVEPSSLLPRERWAKAFSRRNDRILRRVIRRLGFEPASLVRSLMNDAMNPNAHRISLLEEVQYGSFRCSLDIVPELELVIKGTTAQRIVEVSCPSCSEEIVRKQKR